MITINGSFSTDLNIPTTVVGCILQTYISTTKVYNSLYKLVTILIQPQLMQIYKRLLL